MVARLVFGALLACGLLAATGALSQEGEEGAPKPLDLRPQKQLRAPAPVLKPPAARAPKPKKIAAKSAPALVPVQSTAAVAEAAPLPTSALKVAPEREAERPVPPEAAKAPVEPRPPFDEKVIAQFCTILSTAASDGRLAWQARQMEEMESRLRERIAELEVKRAETAEWLKRREAALRMADETVVAIYSKMRPDAAAAQFSAMDESGAAAILAKLNPRMASTVLNEIDPSRAARIAAEMAGVGVRRE